MLTSGSKKNLKLIPAELCFVAPGNLVKKIDPRLQASVPQLSGKRPTERIGMYDHLMSLLVRQLLQWYCMACCTILNYPGLERQ